MPTVWFQVDFFANINRKKNTSTFLLALLLYRTSDHAVSGYVMRDRSLLRKAKECQRLDCANLEPRSLPCIHVADSPYLVTVKHRGATVPHGPSSIHSARQTDWRPFAHRARTTVIREDKSGLASESCSIDTIHLKILNDHTVLIDLVCQQPS